MTSEAENPTCTFFLEHFKFVGFWSNSTSTRALFYIRGKIVFNTETVQLFQITKNLIDYKILKMNLKWSIWKRNSWN